MPDNRHWNSYHQVTFEVAEETPKVCHYHVDYATWAKNRCHTVLASPDYIGLQHAKLDVLTRYFDFLAVVPKAHRECVSERGHRCIYHVFVETYKQLKAAELSINPPSLLLPPAPPATRVVKVTTMSPADFADEDDLSASA